MDDLGRTFSKFASRRSVVYSKKGIVACSQPLAAQAGLDVLKAGGNAIEAAVATAAALCVTEPCSVGLGGDMFCLYWNESEKKLYAVNGSGRAPGALTLEKCREMGFKEQSIPSTNINTVTVPGATAGMLDAIDKHGSKKVSLDTLFAPAIELAETGYPVSEVTSSMWIGAEELIKNASPNGHEILKEGKAPRPGEIFKNPYLASVFREVAAKGKDGYYKGRVAQEIVNVITELGGVMTLEDLASHTTTFEDPISIKYRDIELWECAPNGQGLIALIALGYIKSLEEKGIIPCLEKLGHNTGEYLHVIIEALRAGFADGYSYIADSEMEKLPIDQLLSTEYLSERISEFSSKSINASLKHGNPLHSSDTVYFSTSDPEGNACSFIMSNAADFGMAAIPKGCGFPLQNRGSGFRLEESHYNCIKPYKRPYHTIIPAMITKNGQFDTCFGVMGGFMQPQGQVQVLLNILLFGLNPQEALDSPRVQVRAGLHLSDKDDKMATSSEIFIEQGISEEAIAKLKELGHNTTVWTGWKRGLFGRGQMIRSITDSNGERVYVAGSDLRGDGHAVPM